MKIVQRGPKKQQHPAGVMGEHYHSHAVVCVFFCLFNYSFLSLFSSSRQEGWKTTGWGRGLRKGGSPNFSQQDKQLEKSVGDTLLFWLPVPETFPINDTPLTPKAPVPKCASTKCRAASSVVSLPSKYVSNLPERQREQAVDFNTFCPIVRRNLY
jgi:hypothetical protein